MIYTLTIKSVYGRYLEENCERVLEIEKTASLYELHREIQLMMDFDFDHLYEFYTSRSGHPYRKKGMQNGIRAETPRMPTFHYRLKKRHYPQSE